MALADISGIKSMSVPAWLKLSIFLIVLVVLIGDLAIVWVAIKNPAHKDWFSVSVQLLGTLVPLLLVILLFAFSTRGPEAINRKLICFCSSCPIPFQTLSCGVKTSQPSQTCNGIGFDGEIHALKLPIALEISAACTGSGFLTRT